MTGSKLQDFDDLNVVSGGHLSHEAPTVFVILRNEMYFLPAFLAHYRQLGIERFVVLNDRSDDGCGEYLCDQPDVTVVQSQYRYGDTVDLTGPLARTNASGRILFIWRALLNARFSMNRWAMQIDADEFVMLPEGRTFGDIFSQLNDAPFDAVWGPMLDVYPADFATFMDRRDQARIDVTAPWYFDAEPHLELRENRRPKALHPGARARLYHQFGVSAMYQELGIKVETNPLKRTLRQTILGQTPPYNLVRKPVLARWREGAAYHNSHETTLVSSAQHLLPIVHYRFAGSIYDKIDFALRENSYSFNSRDHRLMAAVLKEMAKENASFRYKKTAQVTGYDGFARTGNAMGFMPAR